MGEKSNVFCNARRIGGISCNYKAKSTLKVNIMNEIKTLRDIEPGHRASVQGLTSTGAMRRRLLDIGLVQGTAVECLGRSPSGDPSAYMIRGAVIAIRDEDCRNILVNSL